MPDDPNRPMPPDDTTVTPGRNRLSLHVDAGGQQVRPAERGQGYDGYGMPEEDGLDPFYFLRVLHKRRWTAATAFLLVVVGATIHTFRVVPVYEARVRVLVEKERLNVVKIEDIVAQERSLDAEMAILQSRWLAGKTLESLGLLQRGAPGAATRQDPPAAPSKDSFSLGAAWSPIASAIGGLLRPPRSPPAPAGAAGSGESAAEASQIDGFLGSLTVATATKGVLDIKYRSSDPVLAARVANGLAHQYMEENLEMRFAAIKEVTDWLAARLGEQRRKVDASEEALQRFREQNRIDALEGPANPMLAKLNELAAAITRAQAARLEREALYNKARVLRTDPAALQRLPRMAADPVVQQLRLEVEKLQRDRAQLAETLQERHPEMIRLRAAIQAAQAKLQTEIDRVLESIREDVAAAQAAEASLGAALDGQKREALAQNRKGVELGILEREAQSNRQIYEMLMQRARETNIAREIRPSEIRILDPAQVPRAPILPKKERNMLMALFAGFALAVGLAFGFEQLDSRVKTPDEIKARLGVPFLGFVPEVHARNLSDGAPLMTNGAPPPFIEAVRSLRTNLLFSFTEEALKTVAVTSAGLSEGKTVVTANLAIALAQAGQRVLLMDADLRRPTIHEIFRIEREPGLSNLLVGNAKASAGVRHSPLPNLWILPAGHRSPRPSELLGSPRFKKFLATLGEHFDWVLIDTPPVIPVTDACVVGHVTSGVLLVVGADRVSGHAARRALEQLAATGAHVTGAVLTRVDLHRNPYYYSPYYHRKYGRYYSHSEPSKD